MQHHLRSRWVPVSDRQGLRRASRRPRVHYPLVLGRGLVVQYGSRFAVVATWVTLQESSWRPDARTRVGRGRWRPSSFDPLPAQPVNRCSLRSYMCYGLALVGFEIPVQIGFRLLLWRAIHTRSAPGPPRGKSLQLSSTERPDCSRYSPTGSSCVEVDYNCFCRTGIPDSTGATAATLLVRRKKEALPSPSSRSRLVGPPTTSFANTRRSSFIRLHCVVRDSLSSFGWHRCFMLN